MKALYDQLAQMTIVVADTGDINAIKAFRPRDATTNPSLIASAAQMPEYRDVVDEALGWAKTEVEGDSGLEEIARLAIDRLSVEFGLRILQVIDGRVSTEVDARLSFDKQGTIAKARHLIAQYEAAGVARERILIKIASTWEGIHAAETLEQEGIHCNLTLLFGIHQAVACADAKVTLVSPFVGRILDWHKKETGRESYPGAEDPGVQSVTQIYQYYKRHGYRTEVMAASFRNIDEICELAGCDLMTISPKFLKELQETQGDLPLKLDAEAARTMDIPPITMTRQTFDEMHEIDCMTREKLDEGIAGFSKAIVALQNLLLQRLDELEGKQRICTATHDLFGIYDLDGDGVITREEWAGIDAVFDALDLDNDGCITAAELAAGLGAAHCLQTSDIQSLSGK